MDKKYVKDRAHNRYPAYCCDDIDERVGALEEAVSALVAGTVPDGVVTLAKLADDARSWAREINKGLLLAEWVGTQAEYEEHLAENGGQPLANVKYIITDTGAYAQLTADDYPVGSIVTVGVDPALNKEFYIGDICDKIKRLGSLKDKFFLYASYNPQTAEKWRCIGYCGEGVIDDNITGSFYMFQRVE